MTSHTYVYLWALALVLIPRIVDAQAEDFLVIKNRVVQELLKEKIDDESAKLSLLPLDDLILLLLNDDDECCCWCR